MMEHLSLQAWEAFDLRAPAPTFFARPAFAKAYCDATPQWRPSPFAVHLNGARYVVPALASTGRSRFVSLSAFPLGGYGCVLDDHGRPASAAATSAVLQRVARAAGRFDFVAWPLGPQPSLPSAGSRSACAAAIDCSQGVERALSGMRGVTRRMAGQAKRRGIVCRQVPCTADNLDRYYAMLSEASVGWGLEKPTLSRALLGAVAAHGGDDAELWFAMLDDEPVGGGYILFGTDELFFWSAAMRREFSAYRPSNALNLRLIERACERRVHWYNLGASEGLAGVERFKHDLGAQDMPYVQLELCAPTYRVYERVRAMIGSLVAS